jgi:hypothetical protein
MALPTPKRVKGLLELMDEALDMDAAKEAVLRLGLKADNTAADRAKAMGFSDDTYYHGSANNIDEFRPGTFFADEGDSASSYAMDRAKGTGQGSNITPIKTRANNIALPDDVKESGKSIGGFGLLDVDNAPSWEFTTPKTIGAYNAHDPANKVISKLKNDGYDSAKHFDEDMNRKEIESLQIFNPGDIRSIFAKFNPKYAGIGAGSIMSSNLLAAPSGQPEFREAPMSLLDKAKKYAADSYEYAANEGGPIGKFLYSGGAEALKDIEQGTTPMVKTGRLPAMPTGAALARLLELLQL